MNYTALTIGPIHKTLQSVKSTKAIWSASYMFSYLIKEMIKKLNGQNKFVLPYSGEVKINGNPINPLSEKFKAGLFPDRFIIEGEVKLQDIINDVLNTFSKESRIPVEYLQNFINFYHLTKELGKGENVIFKINELLDSLELQQRVIEDANKDYLVDFLEQKYPYNYFVRDEFTKRPFPSTIEISTAEFYERYKNDQQYKEAVKKLKEGNDENQIEFIKDIKNIVGDSFRNYQKYIAVVQADGDNIGTFIKSLYEQDNKEENIKRFSKNLLCFAIEAVKLIKSYNGTPIYAGGDDLLFFAPVAHTTVEGNVISPKKTILTLISQIDNLFKSYFTDYNQDGIDFKSIIEKIEKKPTMSYGVSISYYKFPLNQALEEGLNQLFYTAKKTEKKNAVSYTILKHSGQNFGTTFHKDEDSYSIFTNLFNEKIIGDNFIHSIVYKLEPQKAVLYSIGCEHDKKNRDAMFDNFFNNNFNESIHTERDKDGNKKLIPFLEQTRELIKAVYTENPVESKLLDDKEAKKEKEKKNDDNILKIYSALRFIDFINNKEERDD